MISISFILCLSLTFLSFSKPRSMARYSFSDQNDAMVAMPRDRMYNLRRWVSKRGDIFKPAYGFGKRSFTGGEISKEDIGKNFNDLYFLKETKEI